MQRSAEKTVVDFGQQETRVWLQVLSLHGNIFSTLNATLNAKVGLSVAKFDVLAQLYRYKEGLTLGKLSQNLKVTGGNVSGLVQRLLADGLISKSMSTQDRRSFFVRLTPKGHSLFLKAAAVHQRHLRERFENASAGELDNLLSVLRAVSSNVQGTKPTRASKK